MTRKCPICGSIQHTDITRIHMTLPQNIPLPDQYSVVACNQCGFCYADTPATQDDYDVYYSVYNNYSGGEANKTFFHTFAPVKEFLKVNVSTSDRILDIGFGKGELLLHIRGLGYTRLTGLDPSQHSVDKLTEQGIEAYRRSVYDEPGALAGCFDLVFLTSVLEHLLNPRAAIMQAGAYLKHGGYLIIDIPDYAQCSKVDLPIPNQFNQEHINFFSEDSFLSLISTTDFQMLSSKPLELNTAENRNPEYSKMFMLQKSRQGGSVLSIQKDLKTKDSIERYLLRQNAQREKTTDMIDELCAKQTPLLVWGSGALAMSLLASTELQKCNIIAFVDGNPLKAGTVICDRAVIAPDSIQRYPEAVIAICAMKFVEEIKAVIAELALPNPVIVFT